jgi:hypothetical protein
MDVDASGDPPGETTPREETEAPATQEQAAPPSVHGHTSREPSSALPRERLPLQPTSGNRKRNSSPTDKIDSEKRKSPRTADVQSQDKKGKGKQRDSVVVEQTPCDTNAEQIVRVDSPFGLVYSSTYTDLALLQNNADDLRAILEEFQQIAGSQHRHEASSRADRRPQNPLQNWREAPERLNEAEKDALQDAIREAHRRDLEAQLRSSQESSEESEADLWDIDSFFDDSDWEEDEDEDEYGEMDVKW